MKRHNQEAFKKILASDEFKEAVSILRGELTAKAVSKNIKIEARQESLHVLWGLEALIRKMHALTISEIVTNG